MTAGGCSSSTWSDGATFHQIAPSTAEAAATVWSWFDSKETSGFRQSERINVTNEQEPTEMAPGTCWNLRADMFQSGAVLGRLKSVLRIATLNVHSSSSPRLRVVVRLRKTLTVLAWE